MSIIAKKLIASHYASVAATTEYTCPASTNTIIDKFTATNTDVGAQMITVYLVPSGGTAGASNTIISALPLSAGQTKDFSELQNHILNAGDFISVFVSVASKIVIRASGREIV
jgi:hypothetical protein